MRINQPIEARSILAIILEEADVLNGLFLCSGSSLDHTCQIAVTLRLLHMHSCPLKTHSHNPYDDDAHGNIRGRVQPTYDHPGGDILRHLGEMFDPVVVLPCTAAPNGLPMPTPASVCDPAILWVSPLWCIVLRWPIKM